MTYLCGLLTCEVKCKDWPKKCIGCDRSSYTPLTAPNVACYPDLPAEGDAE